MSIKTSKRLWFFSGIWVLLGAAVSAAALFGETVGGLLGLKEIITKLPLYDLAVIYRSNSSLVHILAVLFLVAWLLQGFYTFLVQSKIRSELFVGVNIILLPVWLYSFWSLVNPILMIVQFLIVLALGLSWIIYPWHDLLRKNILLNIDKATDIVGKSKRTVQQKSDDFIHTLMGDSNKTVSNGFTAKAKVFGNTCDDILSEMEDIKKRTKNTIKTSELEGLHVESTLCINKAHAIKKDDLLLKGDDEIRKLTKQCMNEKKDEIIHKMTKLDDYYILSNLPWDLSEIQCRNSTVHIKDIMKEDIDFSDLYDQIIHHIAKIEEYIKEHTIKLIDRHKHLNEEMEKLNTAVEAIDNIKLRQKVDDICIYPIKDKLNKSYLDDYIKSLLFGDADKYYNGLAEYIEKVPRDIEFLCTLSLIMIDAKKSKSFTFTNIEKEQIKNRSELIEKLNPVIIEEFDIDLSNLTMHDLIEDNSHLDESIKNGDYLDYMDSIKATLFLIDDAMKRQEDKKRVEIECYSSNNAETFKNYITKNYTQDIVCNVKDDLIEVVFSNGYSAKTMTKMIENVELI